MFYDVSNTPDTQWETLPREDKKKQLFLNQKQTLELFLERGAISQAQFDKSYNDLKTKMGMDTD